MDMNGKSMTMKSTEIWRLTNAKTLTVQASFTTDNGERKATSVYNMK
jgi:hypothetical protein